MRSSGLISHMSVLDRLPYMMSLLLEGMRERRMPGISPEMHSIA